MLSLAIACRSLGAPVRDCRPAPTVEKKEPITMTHGDGQDRVPTTKFFLTASPNLQDNEGISFLFLDFTLQWDNIRTQMNVLVSKDHPLDAGAKQDNRTKIWMQGVKDITVTLRCTVHHICLPVLFQGAWLLVSSCLVNKLRIQTSDVVVIAKIVPTGMDFWASRRSPDRLEPAMIPRRKDRW